MSVRSDIVDALNTQYAPPGPGATPAKITDALKPVADVSYVAGTPDATLADVTGSHDQAILNANFRDLAHKVNQILAILRDRGLAE